MDNAQKKRVAGISSCRLMSFHFLLLLVNRLEISPTGQGSIFATIRPPHSVSQTISSQTQNHNILTPPIVEPGNRKTAISSGIRMMSTKGTM